MTIADNRDGPTPQREGPRLSFGRQAATPGKEKTGEPLPFLYGTPSGQEDESTLPVKPSDSGNAITYEVDPGPHFQGASCTLVGAPDDGRRARLVYDLLWGRWSRPPEAEGAAVPVPPRPPVLTGGAAAEVETPTMAA